MKIRTSIPNKNDYYIRQASGGLNGAVQGYPTVKGANVLCNCVGYANGRFNEIINDPNLKGIEIKFKYQLVCNAENFIESAKRQGLKISSKPTLGGIMVWQKGATLGGGDGAGHVAIVEEVYADGSILTSESGYGSMDWAFKNLHRTNSNGRWGQAAAYKFRGCIINPSVKDEAKGTYKLEEDGIGGRETVIRMQEFFGTYQDGIISGQAKAQAKYYPSLKAVSYTGAKSTCIKNLQKWVGTTQDGILGQATVKAWQKKLGVTVDGIFGTASMKAWQKYLNENDKPVYPDPKPTPAKTIIDEELDVCPVQAEWMKNYTYKWESSPTVAKSKKYGTCVTYVACVLQRIKVLKSGEYIWHNASGKVVGAKADKMTVSYPSGTIKGNKSKLKRGDIVMAGDKSATQAGGSSHIFILTGEWDSNGNPYIWDNNSAHRIRDGKAGRHTYNGGRKIIALVRLK